MNRLPTFSSFGAMDDDRLRDSPGLRLRQQRSGPLYESPSMSPSHDSLGARQVSSRHQRPTSRRQVSDRVTPRPSPLARASQWSSEPGRASDSTDSPDDNEDNRSLMTNPDEDENAQDLASDSTATDADESYESSSYSQASYSEASADEEMLTINIPKSKVSIDPQTGEEILSLQAVEQVLFKLGIWDSAVDELPRTRRMLQRHLRHQWRLRDPNSDLRLEIMDDKEPLLEDDEKAAAKAGSVMEIEVEREVKHIPHQHIPHQHRKRRRHHATRPKRFRKKLELREDIGHSRQATWLELFFDVFYVTVVGTLTHDVQESNWESMAKFALLFWAIWLTWVSHTLYANRFDTDDVVYRLIVLLQMMALAGMSMGVDDFFSSQTDNLLFSASYALFHFAMVIDYCLVFAFVLGVRMAALVLILGHSFCSVMWLISMFNVSDVFSYIFQIIGLSVLVIAYVRPKRSRLLPFNAPHLPERFGLFSIIVHAELVIGTTSEIADVDAVSPKIAFVGALFLALSFSLWGIYFDDFREEDIFAYPISKQLWVWFHVFFHGSVAYLSSQSILLIALIIESETSEVCRRATGEICRRAGGSTGSLDPVETRRFFFIGAGLLFFCEAVLKTIGIFVTSYEAKHWNDSPIRGTVIVGARLLAALTMFILSGFTEDMGNGGAVGIVTGVTIGLALLNVIVRYQSRQPGLTVTVDDNNALQVVEWTYEPPQGTKDLHAVSVYTEAVKLNNDRKLLDGFVTEMEL
eukprot:Clim_evm48s134 gene=Clim_evmTU48s134